MIRLSPPKLNLLRDLKKMNIRMKTIIDPHLNKIKCPRLTEKESQKKKGDSKRMKIKKQIRACINSCIRRGT